MRVFVNGKRIDLIPGMTVRHALEANFEGQLQIQVIVTDRWGNRLGLDGAVSDGTELIIMSEIPTDKK